MKKFVMKLALRKELREARRAKEHELVDLLTQVLADDDVLELATLAAEAEFEYAEDLKGGGFGDAIQRFFQFIMENKEEIFAFLQILMTLFLAEPELDEDA